MPRSIPVQLDPIPMLQIYSDKKIVLCAQWVTTVWEVNLHPRHHAPGGIIALRGPRLQQSFLALQAHTTTKLETSEYRTALNALLVIIALGALQSRQHALLAHFQNLLEQRAC